MRPSAFATSFGLPFLVTLAGLVPVAVMGSCDNVTTCGAKSFSVLPIMLIVALITGFVAGRVSSSWPIGLAALVVATGLVAGMIATSGLWYSPAEPESGIEAASSWLFVAGLLIAPLLPGFAIGRWRHDKAVVAGLQGQRDAGGLGPEEFDRAIAKLGPGWSVGDQAPPNHRCGRCGKPLSPVWRARCKHCGAPYAEFPPVPRTSEPGR